MKRNIFLLFILPLVFPVFQGCSKDDSNSSSSSDSINYIHNSSFEYNNLPSSDNWQSDQGISVIFSNDVPPGGGTWSVMLQTVWGPVLTLENTVAAVPGTQFLRYSAWCRGEGITGKAEFYLIRQKSMILRKGFDITDSSWVWYSYLDTVTLVPGDSLCIRLSGGFSNLLTGSTWFDLCKIEKLYNPAGSR
jgi:hypothetical protein